MVAKTKASHVDRAMPAIRKPRRTDADKLTLTRSMSDTIKASPEWGAAIDVQAATNGWNTAADAIDAQAKMVASLEDQLNTAVSHLGVLRRDWQAATKHLTSTVNVFCKGSVNRVKAFGFDVVTRGTRTPLVAPSDLAATKGKTLGAVNASWSRGSARNGFVVQHAMDPANPATYSAFVPCTKPRYTLEGAPSGSLVYLRVAAVDPTEKSGLGPWSEWTGGTVA
jgi:hypothetical protein